MSLISSRQRRPYRFPKRYFKRRKYLASMVISWPGMIRPKTKGWFLFLKDRLISKRDNSN